MNRIRFHNLAKNDQQKSHFQVVLITAIYGALRHEEIIKIEIVVFEDLTIFIKIRVPLTKTVCREFTIMESSMDGLNCCDFFRKNSKLRPGSARHHIEFFIFSNKVKCSTQPLGNNTCGNIPRRIAEFSSLQNPAEYTCHCFRRSSASLLANSGAGRYVHN